MASKAAQAIDWAVYRPRKWGQSTKAHALRRPWYGLDTERDAATGEFVCGFAVSDEATVQFWTLRDLPPGTYWVWNLAYDVEGMLRDLGVDEAWCARKDAAQFELLGGRCRYFHGKRFDWQGPNGRVTMIEASSFWGRIPLRMIGSKAGIVAKLMSLQRYNDRNATVAPDDVEPGAEHLIGVSYREAVDAYCVQDSRIVVDAVEQLHEGTSGLGVSIGGTPGATARRFLARLPDYSPVLWRTHKNFLRSYCGGRFEVVKRGYIGDAYQYDITSAYPWALSQCPWLTKTAEQHLTDRLNDDALYGSFLVDFKTDEYLGISPEWRGGVRVYSKAQDKTWLTLPELQWLQDQGYDYTIHRGVEIVDENATTQWGDVIHELYAIKARHRDEPLGKAAKIVLNSMYGVLIQLIPKSGEWVPVSEAENPIDFAGIMAYEAGPEAFEAGQYYAPAYAGHLTALTRIKLLDAARMAGEHYVGGHTDSVLSMKPLQLPTGALGAWDLEAHEPDVQVSKTGMYAIGDKVKMRGITRSGGADMLWAETHTRNQRTGLKRAKSWSEVSLIQPTEVANNYQVEQKRVWEKEFDISIVQRQEFIDSEALQYV